MSLKLTEELKKEIEAEFGTLDEDSWEDIYGNSATFTTSEGSYRIWDSYESFFSSAVGYEEQSLQENPEILWSIKESFLLNCGAIDANESWLDDYVKDQEDNSGELEEMKEKLEKLEYQLEEETDPKKEHLIYKQISQMKQDMQELEGEENPSTEWGSDPVGWMKNTFGYSLQEMHEHGMINVDYETLAIKVVEADGPEISMSPYNGDSTKLPGGEIVVREY